MTVNSTIWALQLYFRSSENGAQMLASSLYGNHKLKTLTMYWEDITTESWSSFTKLVCNTTSIDSTFMSNHTLTNIHANNNIPNELRSLLCLNDDADKKEVTMTKILKYHRGFNIHPFFEWDLKVLPLMISWFERAALVSIDFEAHIDDRKFSAIYQFLQGMPIMAIESWSSLLVRAPTLWNLLQDDH